MNRVLSIESSRGCNGDSAFITKRLCISVLLSIAFLSLLGGFIFGRLSTERECRLKSEPELRAQYKRAEIETLVASIDELIGLTHNASKQFGLFDEFRRLLICDRFSSVASDHYQLADYTKDVISAKLRMLVQCLDEASALVRN